MDSREQQTGRGLAWERSRMDRLVAQYARACYLPGSDRLIDAEMVSRLWLCLRAEGYGLKMDVSEDESA